MMWVKHFGELSFSARLFEDRFYVGFGVVWDRTPGIELDLVLLELTVEWHRGETEVLL